MAIINYDGISGINSITSVGGGVKFYDTTGASSFTITPSGTGGASLGDVVVSSINSGPLGGTRNRLINGSFDVWQRGASFTNMTSGTTYTADRWSCFRDGYASNISVSQITGLSQNGINRIALRCQRTAGDTSTAGMNVTQSLESVNSRDLAGQTVTLSFWARAGTNYSASGNILNAYIFSGTGSDEGQRNGLTGQTSGTITPVLTTSFQKFSFSRTLPSNINQITVSFYQTPTGTAGSNDYFDIMDVQLEAGTVATPFERRSYGQELALCQRYFYGQNNSAGQAYYHFGIGSTNNNTTAFGTVIFPVTMRAKPSVTISAANTFYIDPGITNYTSVIADQFGINAGSIYFTGGTSSTNTGNRLLSNNTSAAYIFWSAEL
jgi:hypothetical protein